MDITYCEETGCSWYVLQSSPGSSFQTATVRRHVYRNLHRWFVHGADDSVLREYLGHVDGWVGKQAKFWELLNSDPDQYRLIVGKRPLVQAVHAAGSNPGRPAEGAVMDDGGALTCSCGNSPEASGFETARKDGTRCEPDDSWGGIWRCNSCLLVIDASRIVLPVLQEQ
ncbi:hypothetical protein ACIBH1_45660 [Nonomuraea sp. NPDC050663]|uniref:hypothetical protein n=1 Tax=Nonomuraea sp. NPDC050663 TaxID=3364370 RepID=UPI0037A245DE